MIPAEMDDILAGGNHREKQADCEKKLGSDSEEVKSEGSVVAASVIEEHGKFSIFIFIFFYQTMIYLQLYVVIDSEQANTPRRSTKL